MSSLAEVVNLYNNDNKRKGRVAIRGGLPTKDFLRRNRAYIKEGLATYYADKTKVFNPTTKAFVDRFTKTGLVKRKYQAKNLVGSIIKNKNVASNVFRVKETDNYFYLYKLITENNISGRRRIIIKSGNTILRDLNVNIPTENIGSWYANTLEKSIQLESGLAIYNQPSPNGYTIIFTKEEKLSPVYINQVFANNEMKICFFNPILRYLNECLENVETPSSKKKYQQYINKITGRKTKTGKMIDGYIHKFPNGVPQNEIQGICDEMRLGFDIYKVQEKPFLSYRPSSGDARKVIQYINTRLDHVEAMPTRFGKKNFWEGCYADNADAIILKRDELFKKFVELKKKKQPFIYNKDCYGISSIKTESEYYSIDNKYNEIVNVFSLKNNMYAYRVNATKNPELAKFLQLGTHFNGTRDFVELDNENTDWESIGHIDMEKAYTQYKNSPFYNGFPLRITDKRPVNNYDRAGFYLIKNIDDTNVSENDKKIMKTLSWFHNNNIYTQPELKYFASIGYKFQVIHGAFCVEPIDIDLSETIEIDGKEYSMLEKCVELGNDVSISAYCKYIGSCSRFNEKKRMFMNCDKKYAQTLAIENENIFFNDVSGKTTIEIPKHTIYTMTHFSAQITAYQRLIMLEQLRKFNVNDIYRVCVDGIYFKKGCAKIFPLVPSFRIKEDKMTFLNYECEHYLSNIEIDKSDIHFRDLVKKGANSKKTYAKSVFIKGAGGTGKTYGLGIDKGLIDVLYVAPSWLLASKQEKWGWECSVHHRLFDNNKLIRGLMEKPNIIIDEASMLSEGQKKQIFQNLPQGSRIFFLGDLDCQLPPVFPDTKTLERIEKTLSKEGFKGTPPLIKDFTLPIKIDDYFDEVIEKTHVYRFVENDKLHELASEIRNNINGSFQYLYLILKKYCKTIKKEEMKNIYKATDAIIASTHSKCNEFTEMFNDLEKYKIKETRIINNEKYYNGQIVYKKPEGIKKNEIEKRHGFTIHSYQGCDVDLGRNLFIDLNLNITPVNQFDCNKMLYTAISRAKSIDQIFLLD